LPAGFLGATALRLSVSNSGELKPFEAVIRVKVAKVFQSGRNSSPSAKVRLAGCEKLCYLYPERTEDLLSRNLQESEYCLIFFWMRARQARIESYGPFESFCDSAVFPAGATPCPTGNVQPRSWERNDRRAKLRNRAIDISSLEQPES